MSPGSAQGAKKQLQREQSVENEGCLRFFLINSSFHRQLSASSCSQQPVVKCSSRKPQTTCRTSTQSECCWKQDRHFLCAWRCGLKKGQKVTGLAIPETAWPHRPHMAGEQACRNSSVWGLGTALYLEKVQSAFLEVFKRWIYVILHHMV